MIVINQLKKSFPLCPGSFVLDGIDFNVKKGEFVGLIGKSGSGKTTLLNIIGLLDQPTSGTVVLAGQNLEDLRGNDRADFRRNTIGFVFQLFNLLPDLNVLQNVMLPLLPYKKALSFDLETRAKEKLDRVGLSDKISSFPNFLSGGEQQRVALARALINEPEVILADEPTGNLDPVTGNEVITLLSELARENEATILMVTHNPDLTSKLSRVLRIVNGKIVESN